MTARGRPRREPPWRTLRGRLVLASLAGIVAAAVVFGLVSANLVQSVSAKHAREDFDQETVRVAKLVSANISRDVTRGTCETYSPEAIEAFVGPGARLYTTGPTACPGTADRLFPQLPAHVARLIDRREIVRNGFVRLDPIPLVGDANWVVTAAPVIVGGANLQDVVIARPAAEVRSPVADVVPRLVAAAVIGFVPAVLLTLLLTTRLTRPIRLMREATDRVAAGNLSTELGRAGVSDLDALVDDFNVMVKRLRQRDDQSRDFLMKVTHEFRTPLTAIRGHAAALADGVVPDGMRGQSFAAIEGEAERLERMVRDLLDLARMEAQHFRLSIAAVDPRPIIESVVALHAPQAAAQQVTMTADIGEVRTLQTDADRLRQIVANLVDNALRWTPPGGSVELHASSDPDGGLRVAVDDSGPGVPNAARESIFQPFQSGETPDGRTGTGLGLAICRQLAIALGGDVVASDAPTGGARFLVTLAATAPTPPRGRAAGMATPTGTT